MKQTKVIESSTKVCFSTEPVKQCPPNTYPITEKNRGSFFKRIKGMEKPVPFICLNRSDDKTKILMRRVRNGNILNMTEHDFQSSTTKTVQVQLPIECARYS